MHLITYRIEVTDIKPIRARRYRYPPALKEQIEIEVNKLIDQGIIEASNSSHSSPTWIVPKRSDAKGNKKWYLLIDLRHLNEITVGSCHPLPFMSDILKHLA